MLGAARRTSARAVPLPAYLAGMLVILCPGGREVVVSRRVQRLRRAVARLLGYETFAARD